MRKIIIREDLDKILSSLGELKSPKEFAVFLIAFTGARPSEILNLTSRSLDVDANKIHIIAAKNGQSRWILLPNEFKERMKYLSGQLGGRSLAFLVGNGSVSTSYELLRLFFNSLQVSVLGEKKYTLKSFRHSLAVRALKSGLNIIKVKSILGHKSIKSTMEYLREYEESLVLDSVHELVRSAA